MQARKDRLNLQTQRGLKLFRQSVVGIEYFDKDGILVEANEACCEIFGVKDVKTLLAAKLSLFDDPNGKVKLDKSITSTITSIFKYDFSNKKSIPLLAISDRTDIAYVKTCIVPYFDKNGKFDGAMATSIEVTDIYKATANYKKSQSRFLEVLNVEKIVAWTYVLKDKKVYIEDNGGLDILPVFEDPLLYVYDEDKVKVKLLCDQIIRGESDSGNVISRYVLPGGEPQYYSLSLVAYKENGKVIELIGSSKNINDDYQKQERLKSLTMSLDLALDSGDMSVWKYDSATKLFEVIKGAPIYKKIMTLDEFFTIVHPEDLVLTRKLLDSLIHGDVEKGAITHRLLTSEGKYIYSHHDIIAQKVDGKVVSVVGARSDVTMDMRYQQELEDTVGKFKFTLIETGATYGEYEVATGKFSAFNEELNNFDENVELSFNDYLKIIHPEDKSMVVKLMEPVWAGKNEKIIINARFRIDPKDDWHFANVNIMPFNLDKAGYVTRYVCIVNDITELTKLSQQYDFVNAEKQAVLENLPVAVAMYDSDGRQEYLNNMGYSMFGVEDKVSHAARHISIYDDPIIPDDIKEKIRKGEDVDTVMSYDLSAPNKENYFSTALNKTIYLRGIVKYIRDDAETVSKIILLMTDITQSQLLKDELVKNIEKTKYAIQASNISFWDYDCYTRTLKTINDPISGFNDNEILSAEDYRRCVFVEDLPKFAFFSQYLVSRENRPYSFDMRAVYPDGALHYCTITGKPFEVNEDGKVLRYVGFRKDNTELMKIQERLSEAKERAENADKLKSAFLANMSHEIRTPLNAIVGFSELLQSTDDREEREQYGNIINHNSDLLLRLIGDILDLSKIESGTIEMKENSFDFSEAFNELFTSLKTNNQNAEIEFIGKNPYKHCIVKSDKDRLTQVLTNFVTNAMKYTPKGTITVGYEYLEHGIKMYVQDTGIGIATSKQHLIFQRFEKLDNFAQGTGLGLAISKAIMERFNGKIGFESTEGVGSLFWAWFPADPEIEGESIAQTEKPNSPEISSNEVKEFENDHVANILVAEDNDSNYILVDAILRSSHLTRAVNGVEAVDLASRNEYDMILMDIKMPLMDGLEATRKIREFDKKTPIYAVTANAFDSDKEKALAAGCTGYIAKPIKKSELISLLDGKN
jgi:signal transduction histidine kinase/CheY-like chemotaxis protein/transcriptional regulator with PAS, ATPase and Fis domain